MLRIQHLTKTYGDKKAVDDLSLHICPGEIYGFIGHNGAGKTTTPQKLLRHLAVRGRGYPGGRDIHPHRPAGLQAADGLHPPITPTCTSI